MGVLTWIGLGWRSRVGNGQTKSGVLTSNGYRSWTVELDQEPGQEEDTGKSRTRDGCSIRDRAVVHLGV